MSRPVLMLDLPTGKGPRGAVLTVQIHESFLWAGLALITGSQRTSLCCTTRDGKRVYAYADSISIGGSFDLAAAPLKKLIGWLRSNGVEVEIEDRDADALGVDREQVAA